VAILEWLNSLRPNMFSPFSLLVEIYEKTSILLPVMLLIYLHFLLGETAPNLAMTSFTRFLDHTQRRTTVGRTALND
jgi:hypothetical protein